MVPRLAPVERMNAESCRNGPTMRVLDVQDSMHRNTCIGPDTCNLFVKQSNIPKSLTHI